MSLLSCVYWQWKNSHSVTWITQTAVLAYLTRPESCQNSHVQTRQTQKGAIGVKILKYKLKFLHRREAVQSVAQVDFSTMNGALITPVTSTASRTTPVTASSVWKPSIQEGLFHCYFLQSSSRLAQDHVLTPHSQPPGSWHLSEGAPPPAGNKRSALTHRQHQMLLSSGPALCWVLCWAHCWCKGCGMLICIRRSAKFHSTYWWRWHIWRGHYGEQRPGTVSFKWRWNKPFPIKYGRFMKWFCSPLYLEDWNPLLCTDLAWSICVFVI